MLIQIPNVLPEREAARLCERLRKAEFIDGSGTAGHLAVGTKRNEELPPDQTRLELGRKVNEALAGNPDFNAFALVRRMPIPLFSRYAPGMAYGRHSDEAILGLEQPDRAMRNDLAMTLFLSDPASYDGGELSVETPVGPHLFKLPAGHAVIYPSQYLHEVRTVTRGVRYAAVNWLQSFVRDTEQRAILHELGTTAGRLRQLGMPRTETEALYNSYNRLLRLWASM